LLLLLLAASPCLCDERLTVVSTGVHPGAVLPAVRCKGACDDPEKVFRGTAAWEVMQKDGGLERHLSDAEKAHSSALGALAQRALGDAIALTMWESQGNYDVTRAAIQHSGGFLATWFSLRQAPCRPNPPDSSAFLTCLSRRVCRNRQARTRALHGKDHDEVHQRCVADLATLAQALSEKRSGPYIHGNRASQGDATVLGVLVFALHSPYSDPVWDGKTLGNLVAAHPALQEYYTGILPTLVASGKMQRPEDFTPSEGQFIPVMPKVASDQPGVLDKAIGAYRELFGHREGTPPELSEQQKGELAKRYRNNAWFGAIAVGTLWLFGRSKWDWRDFFSG